jgi:hypothetical protein
MQSPPKESFRPLLHKKGRTPFQHPAFNDLTNQHFGLGITQELNEKTKKPIQPLMSEADYKSAEI